jgi:hypothetical protein
MVAKLIGYLQISELPAARLPLFYPVRPEFPVCLCQNAFTDIDPHKTNAILPQLNAEINRWKPKAFRPPMPGFIF